MILLRAFSFALVVAASAIPGKAQQPPHHPASATASTSKAMAGKGKADMARMDVQMKAMKDMHEKMMAAKTPEERNALMAEHMKIMQECIGMMNGMSDGNMGGMKGDTGTRLQMMEKRMDMMQSMMTMMMDRMPAAPPM